MIKKCMSCFALMSLLFSACNAAHAAFTTFTSQASFLAAIENVGVDSFDDLGNGAELDTPLHRMAGSYAYTASVGPGGDFFTASENNVDIWLSSNIGSDVIAFGDFSSGVQAVGGFFFGTDFAGTWTTVTFISLSATDADGTISRTVISPNPASFVGFVSDTAIMSVKLTLGNLPGVWPTVNDLTLGRAAPVPEIPTMPLLLIGLGCIAHRWTLRVQHAKNNRTACS